MLVSSYEIITRFFISIALGTLIGLERQRIEKRIWDIKVFSIVAILGCIAVISILTDIPFSEYFPLTGFLMIIYYIYNEMKKESELNLKKKTDMITTYSLPIVYLIGLLIGNGFLWESAGLTFLILGILAIGRKLERAALVLTDQEVSEIIQIGVILFIVFPLLPNEPIILDGISIDVFLLFAFLLLVTLLNLFAFIAYRIFKRETTTITGFVGGIINSTYTIYQLNKASKKNKGDVRTGGVTAAMLGSITRNALLAIIIMPDIAETLLPMFALIAAIMVFLIFLERRSNKNGYRLNEPVTMINSIYAAGVLFIALILFQIGAKYFPAYLPVLSFVASTISSGYTMLSLGSVYMTISYSEIVLSVIFAILGSFFTSTLTAYLTNKKIGYSVLKQTLFVTVLLIAYMFFAHVI